MCALEAAALVCASVSCPDLRREAFALDGGTLDRALDEQMAAWLASDGGCEPAAPPPASFSDSRIASISIKSSSSVSHERSPPPPSLPPSPPSLPPAG